MKASVIQSLLSRNRRDIRFAEEFAANYKAEADAYFGGGDGYLEEAYRMVKLYRKEKAEIKKLVGLQKELKKHLRLQQEFENMSKKFVESGMAYDD